MVSVRASKLQFGAGDLARNMKGAGSLGAVLNAFARVLNVLAKAVGSVATEPDNSQETSDE